MIKIEGISKVYYPSKEKKTDIVKALDGISLVIKEGEFVTIMGPSGCGKSTLLSIIGCLDIPTTGRYLLENKDISSLTDDELSLIRNEKMGFIFQAFYLLPRFNALENVELPLIYKKVDKDERHQMAKACLERVGLGDRIFHSSSELSGGEQQRVAIARAVVHSPKVILADEPTGNLDSTTSQEIISLLVSLNKERNITLIVVTHNPEVANVGSRTIYLRDGRIINEDS